MSDLTQQEVWIDRCEEIVRIIKEKMEESFTPKIIDLSANTQIGIYVKRNKNTIRTDSDEQHVLLILDVAEKLHEEIKAKLIVNPELIKAKKHIFVFVAEEKRVGIYIDLWGMHPLPTEGAVRFIINQLRHLI